MTSPTAGGGSADLPDAGTPGGAAGSASSTAGAAGAAAGIGTGDGDFTIAPPYSPAPEVVLGASGLQGKVSSFNMPSTDSAIYPTDIATSQPFTRPVNVYVPKQYTPGTAAPFIVVQDGVNFYSNMMIPTLDNMIGQRRLPPMIAIFVEPGPNEATPLGERSFEYDSVSDTYSKFVETELLPKVEQTTGVTLTKDPDGRAAMGGSSGGAAAFTMGWFRPDLYHRILTYSGSFCDLQPSDSYPQGAWEYHDSLIPNNPAKPLRVALEVGEGDLNWNTDTDKHREWLAANRAMAAVLAQKGYHYRFIYALGAAHVDQGVEKQTLPSTLAWLWEGYPIP